MREIKFRIRIEEQVETEEGSGIYETIRKVIYRKIGEMFNPSLFYNETKIVLIEEFTGLLDKNGNEIYEGDIVKLTWFADDDTQIEYTLVKFTKGAFYEGDDLLADTNDELEVVGNIYETPELLK